MDAGTHTGGSFWHRMDVFLLYMTLMCAVIHYGSKAIKERLTYPRTGRVEYSKRDTVWRPMMISFAVSVPFAAALAIGIRRHIDLGSLTPLIGLVLAASYARGFANAEKWKWTVVWVMAACSIAMTLAPVEWIGVPAAHSWVTKVASAPVAGGLWLTMTIYGALLAISGGITLRGYLRRTA